MNEKKRKKFFVDISVIEFIENPDDVDSIILGQYKEICPGWEEVLPTIEDFKERISVKLKNKIHKNNDILE